MIESEVSSSTKELGKDDIAPYVIDEDDFVYLGIMDMSRISCKMLIVEGYLERIIELKVVDELRSLVEALGEVPPMEVGLSDLKEANEDIGKQMALIWSKVNDFPKGLISGGIFDDIYDEIDQKISIISKYLDGNCRDSVATRLSSHVSTLSLCRTSCRLFENHAENEILAFENILSLVNEVSANYIPLWRLMALSSNSLSKLPISIEGYEKYSSELKHAVG